MKQILAIAMGFLLSAGGALSFDPPRGKPNCPQPAPKQDGSGPGAKAGKRSGPRDGTGPIHTPGTGGGSGAGRRAGRR